MMSGGTCIITGAGGFIGQALASSILEEGSFSKLVLTDILEPAKPKISAGISTDIQCFKVDLTDPAICKTLFTPDVKCVYMLHGIMSGQAEADLELGLKVNFDSSRLIFDHLRRTCPGAKVVFTSSTAVYGPPATPDFVYTESVATDPRSSYGAQKHMCETLLNDYSRRGLLDGRICRLPTVVVRPGRPTGAASSFASGIFREPLNGERSILPVAEDVRLWICSPRTVIKNLVIAKSIPEQRLHASRIINLPGITVSVQEMLETLRQVGGQKAIDLVESKIDESTERIVKSWPTILDTAHAISLGFSTDGSLVHILNDYIAGHASQTVS